MARVSVVMASRNPDYALMKRAINSVLKQSFTDYDFIIVDDGSNEPIESIVLRCTDDSRIKVYRIEPSGLGAALNHGIRQSTSEYIARIDDDDMMCPGRLQKQVDFLDEHRDVSCLGTQIYDLVGNKYKKHWHFPLDHESIVEKMIAIRFPLAHTTLMFRRDAFDKIGGYRIPGGGQDMDLILQLGTVGKLANLDEYLSYYTMSLAGLGTINVNKYKAYLFAIESISETQKYPQYKKEIDATLSYLNEKIMTPKKNVLINRVKRHLLALRVRVCGKHLNIINY